MAKCSVTLDCIQCAFDTEDYNVAWRDHLVSESHQERARKGVTTVTVKNKKNFAVVFGVFALENSTVLKYFMELSLVTDLIFWTDRKDFCIVRFFTPGFRDAILSQNHSIQGNNLILRPHEDISELEWMSICPLAVANVKKEKHGNPETFVKTEKPSESSSEDEIVILDPPQKVVPVTVIKSEPKLVASSSTGTALAKGTATRIVKNEGNEPGPNRRTDMINDSHPLSLDQNFSSVITTDGQCSDQYQNDFKRDMENFEESDMYDINRVTSNLENTTKWITDCQGSHNKFLDRIMDELYSINLMPPKSWRFRNYVTETLQHLLQTKFSSCVLIPFGAGTVALSSGRETLNLFPDIWGCTREDASTVGQTKVMDISSEMYGIISGDILTLLKQDSNKSPIRNLRQDEDQVYFDFVDSVHNDKLHCNIQCSNFLTVQTSKLLSFMCSLDSRVRPLLILVRHWSFHTNLANSTSRFSPHVFPWLVLYFLIKKGILPRVNLLQTCSPSNILFRSYNVGFCNNVQSIPWTQKLDYEVDSRTGNPSGKYILSLAEEMFKFYGSLEYNNVFISLNLGEEIARQDLTNKSTYIHRFGWIRTVDIGKLKRSKICIFHPLHTFINMTSSASATCVEKFKNQCLFTADALRRCILGDPEFKNPAVVLRLEETRRYRSPDRTSATIETKKPKVVSKQKRSLKSNEISDDETTSKFKIPAKIPRQKLPIFSVPIKIDQKFKLQGESLAMSKDEICDLWFKLLVEYNELLWPISFGVQLKEIPPISSIKIPENMVLKAVPLHGVIVIHDEILSIVKQFKSKKKSPVKLQSRLKYNLLRKHNSAELKQIIQRVKQSTPTPKDEKLFSFNCHIFGGITKKESAEVRVVFSNTLISSAVVANATAFKVKLVETYKTCFRRYALDHLSCCRVANMS